MRKNVDERMTLWLTIGENTDITTKYNEAKLNGQPLLKSVAKL